MRTTMLTTDEQVRATIGRALRAKYKSPRDVFKRLGLEHVLKHPRLSYDAKFAGPNGSFSKATLDRLLADDTVGLTAPNEGLSDEEREHVNIEVEQAEDEEVDRRVDRVLDHLRTNHSDKLTEDDIDTLRPMIEEEVRDHLRRRSNGRDSTDLPRNAIGGGAAGGGPGSGFQGRLSQRSWRDADASADQHSALHGGTINSASPFSTMSASERRQASEISDRRAARDSRLAAADQRRQERRADFDARFSVPARSWETGLESSAERELRTARAEMARHARSPEKRLAADAKRGKAAKSFRDRWPGAARIGFA